MEGFSPLTQETLGYYVYLLINPLDNKVFYVGKGKDDRVFNHVKAVPLDWVKNEKLDIIRQIIDKGLKVKYYILRHGMTEKEAYLVESAFIDFLTFNDFSFVANISNIAAEYRGIIRTIFKVDEKGWQRVESEENAEYFKGKSKSRYCFERKEVPDEEIIKLYLHKRLPLKSKGQANPIWYLY